MLFQVVAHGQTDEQRRIMNNIDEITHHGELLVDVSPSNIRLLYTTN